MTFRVDDLLDIYCGVEWDDECWQMYTGRGRRQKFGNVNPGLVIWRRRSYISLYCP